MVIEIMLAIITKTSMMVEVVILLDVSLSYLRRFTVGGTDPELKAHGEAIIAEYLALKSTREQ